MLSIDVIRTDAAPADLLHAIHALMLDAFEEFTEDDWGHALGGDHVVVRDPGLVAHAAVVPRTLEVGGRTVRTGYVEGVATAPARQKQGVGRTVLARVNSLITDGYEMGALSTTAHGFYESLGWQRWRGETYVRRGDELVRTADEDAGVMVLLVGPTAGIDIAQPIVCPSRPGDDW